MVRILLRKAAPVFAVLVCLLLIRGELRADTHAPEKQLLLIEAGARMDYIPAGEKPLTFQELRETENRLNWRYSPDKNINLGYRNTPYWYRFQLENPGPTEINFYLRQNYSLADHLLVYIVENGVLKQTYETGDHFPFASRPIPGRDFAFPVEISAGARLSIYVFMQNNGPQRAAFSFSLPQSFTRTVNIESMLLWLYYGLMLGMIFYNFLIYFSIRNSAYIHYVIFISALTLFTLAENGMGFQYLWPNYPFLQNVLLFPNICLLSYSALKFLLHFLDLKSYSDTAASLINFLARVALGATLLPLLSEGGRVSIAHLYRF